MREVEVLTFEMLLAADKDDKNYAELIDFLELIKDESNEFNEEACQLKHYFTSVKKLFKFEFKECLDSISQTKDYHYKVFPIQEKKLIINCFLFSLGLEINITVEELKYENSLYLIGARLELANNFLSNKFFTLSDKWSKKPSYCYFDRTLYCLWLFEKNHLQILKEQLEILINPKLGNAYFQPFLLALESKLNQKLIGSK
jgi:hypothetical protein